MANELRVRQGFVDGVVDDNPLTSGATTLTSSDLANLVAIGSTQHAVIVLDPDGVDGLPEVVFVTAHTASATTATVVRGREGTAARAHNQNTPWIHGPTTADFDYIECRLTRAATQTLTTAIPAAISWDTEISDIEGWISVPGTVLTCPTGADGLYIVTAAITLNTTSTARQFIDLSITRSGVAANWRDVFDTDDSGSVTAPSPLRAGDTLTVVAMQTSGSNRTATAKIDLYRLHRLKV